MSQVDSPNVPPQIIRPTDLDQPIRVLGEVISDFERWELRVPELGRLRRHMRVLTAVAQAGEYPSSVEDRAEVANAIRDASEFNAIAGALTDKRVEAIALELKRAMGGTGHQLERQRQPYQFQAQYFFGSIMAFSGAQLQVAGGGHSYPDFVVDNGTLRHGIEVKRPEGLGGVERGIRDSAKKLGLVDGGMLVIDASELVAADQLDVVGSEVDGFVHWKERTQPSFAKAVRLVRHTHAKGGVASITASAVFARGWLWREDPDNPGKSLPEFHARFYCETLTRPRGTLRWHRAKFLCRLLETGLQEVGPIVQVSPVDY